MRQTRRQFLKTAVAGSAVLPGAAHLGFSEASAATAPTVSPKGLARPPERPNLLFLWTDQHRGDFVPWAGNSALKASEFFGPLGERSFVFDRACITQPVCTPSRGSIMTGLFPHNHGSIKNNIRLDPAVQCLAEYLPADYATAYFGKWHLGDEITAQHGFKEWKGIEDIYRKYYTDPADLERFSGYHEFLLSKGFPPDELDDDIDGAPLFSRTMSAAMPEPYTKVAYLADEAVRFLHERRDGQPFALVVNSLEPHPPIYGPLNELHDPDKMPVGPAFMREPGPEASSRVRARREDLRKNGFKNHPLETEADYRRIRANYAGVVSMVDRAYGRIIRALEESGQADKTIVVYTSDHGEMLGDHMLMKKNQFYEEAIHVPLAIHVPWLSRRRIDFSGPVSLVDLMPTMLDLLEAGVPAGIDGRSHADALRDPSSWKAKDVVVEINDPQIVAENGRCLVSNDGWKLNLWQGDAPELFDRNSDPGELTNCANDPAHQDRYRHMRDRIQSWQQETGDNVPLRG
jgi:arylsulfatase A-like enzyme